MKIMLILCLLCANSFTWPPDTVKQDGKKKPVASTPATPASTPVRPAPKPAPKKVKLSGPVLPSILIVDF